MSFKPVLKQSTWKESTNFANWASLEIGIKLFNYHVSQQILLSVC